MLMPTYMKKVLISFHFLENFFQKKQFFPQGLSEECGFEYQMESFGRFDKADKADRPARLDKADKAAGPARPAEVAMPAEVAKPLKRW